jgi:hypothetical protein
MVSKFQKKMYVKIHCSFDRFIDKIGRYSSVGDCTVHILIKWISTYFY